MKPILLASLVLCAALSLPARPAAADEYADHVARAGQLEQQQRFREALAEYDAAYALVQSPLLLLYIGRTHSQLGEGREALDFYRRFLVAAPDAVPAARQEAMQEIERLQQIYGRELLLPQAAPGAFRVPQPLSQHEILRRRYRSLSAGGAVLFTLGYIPALAAGSVFISVGGQLRDRTFQVASGMLLIPIAGPFISGFMEPSGNWTVPWIVFDGVAQVGGLAMMILGGKSKRAMERLAQKAHVAELQIVPVGSPAQSGLVVAGRF